MDAHPVRIANLMTGAGTRLVIPVFQRPYWWDTDNCKQLWEDIISVGKGSGAPHFTGSVVMVQQGTLVPAGVTPLMLIDGQQRITSITLLIVALARFVKANPDKVKGFSYREIIGRGYLIDEYKTGDDRYKLTLSQGDRDTLRSLVDNLENPDVAIVDSSPRLLENLSYFEGRVSTYEDPDVVWAGILRLEVVSISLTQGQDNPQLIFESMNSTGKSLSSSDLIRNYVLMGHPDQDNLYTSATDVLPARGGTRAAFSQGAGGADAELVRALSNGRGGCVLQWLRAWGGAGRKAPRAGSRTAVPASCDCLIRQLRGLHDVRDVHCCGHLGCYSPMAP